MKNIKIIILIIGSYFFINLNIAAQNKGKLNIEKKINNLVKESIIETELELEQVSEIDKDVFWSVYNKPLASKFNQNGEKIEQNQFGVLLDNNLEVNLGSNERILILRKEYIISVKYLEEGDLIRTILNRYDLISDTSIEVSRKLELGSYRYPLKTIHLGDESNTILVTDASEGGGEEMLIFYDSELKELQKLTPYEFEYEYSRNFSIGEESIIACIPFFGENIPLKFVVFNNKQKKITDEITIPLDRTEVLNISCSKKEIAISYYKDNQYFLSLYNREGNLLWLKSLEFPANQIDILKDQIVFRGMDLNIYFYDKSNGGQLNFIDLTTVYPFPLEYNKYGLAVSFFDIEINHTLNQDYLIFTIPKLKKGGGRFINNSLIIYSPDNNNYASFKMEGKSKTINFKEFSDGSLSILYGNKIYKYEIPNSKN